MQHGIRFWLNDQLVEERSIPGTTTLLRYLRDQRRLTGTKEGCGEGDCGACTVAILEERPGREATWRAVDSCLIFLPMLQGKRVYTVEALREHRGPEGLHPAQRALVERRGSQCGYCTPGIVMSLFEATYRDDLPDSDEARDACIDDQLGGNLCRCTGYRPLREAGRDVVGLRPSDRFLGEARQYRPGPAATQVEGRDELGREQRYLQPDSLTALFAAREAHPDALLVAGGTDLALEITKRHRHLPVVIGLEALRELEVLERSEAGWTVGARVTLTRLLEEVGPELPALRKILRVFGARQIRNRATVGGNLCNASPIGDLPPLLVALGAVARIAGPEGRRELPLADFLVGYRRTALEGPEILEQIFLPRPGPDTFVSAYKVSKRVQLDISTVAAGMSVRLREGRVEDVILSFGGMSARPGARATRAEQALRGGPWTLEAVEAAAAHLQDDFQPIDDLRGSSRFRALLARNLLVGFHLESIAGDVGADEPQPVGTVSGAALEAR